MESTSLETLRSRVRLAADMRVSGFVTDTAASLDEVINDRCREYRNQLITGGAAGDLLETEETLSIVAGTSLYEIGSGASSITTSPVQQVAEVELLWSADQRERVESVNTSIWQRLKVLVWGQRTPKARRLGLNANGLTLEFSPTPSSSVSFLLRYIPQWTDLAASTDLLLCPEGMTRCVVLDSAIQLRGMVDLPTVYLEKLLIQAVQSFERHCDAIDRDEAPQMRNANPEGSFEHLSPYPIWW